jgi:preprotein translocase subunit Sec63
MQSIQSLVIQLTILIVVLVVTDVLTTTIRDPYEVLGLKKTATIPEIRKAHKSLVKIW